MRSGQWTRTCHTRHAHARSHCGRKAQLIISPGSACELIPRTHTPAPEGRRWGIANTELVGIAVQPRPPGAAVGDDCLVQLVTLRQGLRPGAQRRLTLTLTAARCSASTNPAPNPNPNPKQDELGLGRKARKINLVSEVARHISPASPLHLPSISPLSPLTSSRRSRAISPLHLPCISPASPLHLPSISPLSHLTSSRRSRTSFARSPSRCPSG